MRECLDLRCKSDRLNFHRGHIYFWGEFLISPKGLGRPFLRAAVGSLGLLWDTLGPQKGPHMSPES
jgi:hypothetical protein